VQHKQEQKQEREPRAKQCSAEFKWERARDAACPDARLPVPRSPLTVTRLLATRPRRPGWLACHRGLG